ncbi:MAG: response regulator [Lachnospiraceae bacterium]|nr:response regulator [Lachnospiraceae bacterium]
MIQKDYLINNPMLIGTVLNDLRNTVINTPHKDALLTVFETGFPAKQIKFMLDKIRFCGLGDIKVAGCSLYAIADIHPMGIGVRLNLILTEETDIDIVTVPFLPGEEDRAAEELKTRINGHPDVKAVELIFSGLGIQMTKVMENAFKDREDIKVFGTVASYRMPKNMPVGNFNILNFGRDIFRDNEFVIGDDLIKDGMAAVIFSGEKLRVRVNYALGWHPVGREMSFTVGGSRGEIGETALTEIDGMRAADLFKEYLGVTPNEYFIRNICEFPLMVQRAGIDICLIPFDFGDNGELFFNLALKEGEHLRFSFASHDEVLDSTKESSMTMEDFGPEALFLIMCGNRVNFLQEDAKLEWDGFRDMAPDFALIHGASELYYYHGLGGVLNSAHLAIRMSESEGRGAVREHTEKDVDCMHHDKYIPLSERMSVFMGKMTSQLEGMAEEAQAANAAKSAFLSSMSHEIRTPINAVIGMDEMILRESDEPNITEYAEDIRSASNTLLGIVNDVLDFSKIEAGKMDIIPVEYEFASVINDLYNVIKKRAEDKGLEVKLDIDPSIPSVLYGDEIRIKQVITNILTNAVKYTEKGSVTLIIKRAGSGDDTPSDECDGYSDLHGMACFRNPVTLYIAVKDTGIGIKEEDQEKLFNAFERVEVERNRTVEGTGLGLNITSQLLGLMGSRLNVESTYGEGSVFSFEIVQGISRGEPIGDINDRWQKASSAHKKYHERFTAEAARILIVDDTKMNLEVMKNLLKKTKISIDTADSGQEALDLVEQNEYDMIFLDHRMPVMDGIECFKRMKELPDHKCPDAPVISLTANAVSGAREEYLTIGFADYLAKPIDSEKLEDMLIRYLPDYKVQIVKGTEETRSVKGIQDLIEEKPLIVMIDDESVVHDQARGILKKAYRFEAYDTGERGLAALRENGADLILLDIMMPDEDGFTIIEKINEDKRTKDIPVIFLTGADDKESEVKGLKAGARDFVRKPFTPEVLLQRVKQTINLSRLQRNLSKEVEIKTLRIEHLTQEIMLALSKAVDAKDHYTNGHSERVAGYATMLAAKLGMSDEEQVDIHDIGLLHDVGKIGVPGEIINKPARLTDEEFAQIKQHPSKGYDILKTITELPELAVGARWHHERFDGRGYPDGKAGEDIPFIARIICVADSYDAMTSNRSYSKIRAQADVRAEILRCSGSQFDPGVADKMLQLIDSDNDYLMNEKGYQESTVAKYVEDLLNRTSRTGKIPDEMESEAAIQLLQDEAGEQPEEADEEKLPDWLINSDAVNADEGVKNYGSIESYISILTGFQSTVAEKADEIERYFDDKDWENYTIKVHALKSSARIIGAAELSERARLLEAAGDARNLNVIAEDTPALLALFRSYTDALSPVSEQTEDLPEAPEAMIRDAYQSMAEFAEIMDYETTKMVLDDMKQYKLPAEDKERFDRLRTRLSQLDWDGIKFILKERKI